MHNPYIKQNLSPTMKQIQKQAETQEDTKNPQNNQTLESKGNPQSSKNA